MLRRSRLVDAWDRMKSSYWFVPSIMFLGALALALLTFRFDLYLNLNDEVASPLWFPKFGADAARSILSMLAAGMLTVTGVVFSLTIVALQLASSQFGPRLLRTFMTSKGTQVVLGTFTSSFVFYLLIMGTVRAEIGFVPQVSTATGIVLGTIDVAVLIYFVHHLATSIRIESLLDRLNSQLRSAIDEQFPCEMGEESNALPADTPEENATGVGDRPVRAARAGYIRHIDADMLMSTARQHDLVLRVEQQPGAFVLEGTGLLRAAPGRRVSEQVEQRLRECIILGQDRTPIQDVAFAIQQFVEVALRALSPGINDPFTAIACTNRLAEALCVAARRPRPSARRLDEDGKLRVIAEPASLQTMAHAAFDPIARAGGSNGDVATVVLKSLMAVAACAREADDQRDLMHLTRELRQQMLGQMTLERDRAAVEADFSHALEQLTNPAAIGSS